MNYNSIVRNVKRFFIVFLMALIVLPLFSQTLSASSIERETIDFPKLTGEAFTNFGWNCQMEKGLVNEFGMSGKSIKISKKEVSTTENSIASIYYQSFGTTVASLSQDKQVYGIMLDVFCDKQLERSGMMFAFSGKEQTVVEAYDAGSNVDLATRDLNFTGYRTYVVPFLNGVEISTIGEFQIGVWGFEEVDLYVSNLRLITLESKSVSKQLSFGELTDSSFTNFGYLCSMEKSIETDNAKVGKSLKINKISNDNPDNPGFANVYFQSFGTKALELAKADEMCGVMLDVYCPQQMNESGLMFLFGSTEQATVEAYADGSDNDLASRNLDYTGYRTYVIKFPDGLEIANVGEFQIGIWGKDAGMIYVSNIRLLVNKQEGQRSFTEFPELSEDTFSSFGWLCTIDKAISNTYGGNRQSLKVQKGTISNLDDNTANIYYQSFGTTISSIKGDNEIFGVRMTVYLPSEMNQSGLLFKFGGVEQVNVESYNLNETENLSTRDLNFTGYRTYVIPFPEGVDILTTNEFQIGIWGKDEGVIYISDLKLITQKQVEDKCTEHIDEDNDGYCDICGEKMQEQIVFEAKPEYSYLFEGFDTQESIDKWGISGTSGTIYTKTLNSSADYIKEGNGSILYKYKNELYGFGYTEIYLNIQDLISNNISKGLKGISFDIYNTSEQTLGSVGYWIKIAEADGSEYESNYNYIEQGTGLGFTGWKEIYVPFSAVNNFQSYTIDENDQLDINQIAYLKFGFWTNEADVVEIETYIDNFKLWSEQEITDVEDDDQGNQNIDNEKKDDQTVGCSNCQSNNVLEVLFSIISAFGCILIIKRRK